MEKTLLKGLGWAPAPLVFVWGNLGFDLFYQSQSHHHPWTEAPRADQLSRLWRERNWPREGLILIVPCRFGVFWESQANSLLEFQRESFRRFPDTDKLLQSNLLFPGTAATFRRDEWSGPLDILKAAGLHVQQLVPLPALLAALSVLKSNKKNGEVVWKTPDQECRFFFKNNHFKLGRVGPNEGRSISTDQTVQFFSEIPWKEFNLSDIKFNFLSTEEVKKGERGERGEALRVSFVLLVLLGFLTGAFQLQNKFFQNQALEEIRERRAAWRPVVERLKNRSAAEDKGLVSFPQVLSALTRLPEGIAVESVVFDRTNGVTIRAMALNHTRALNALESLQNMGLFSSVQLASSNAVRVFDRNVILFEMEGKWPPSEGTQP